MNRNYTRREIMACLAAGGLIVGGKLWTPGQKLISIPRPRPKFGDPGTQWIQLGNGLYRFEAYCKIGDSVHISEMIFYRDTNGQRQMVSRLL